MTLDLFRDAFLLSLCSFLGNIGVAVTGFGVAIVYFFVWQILVVFGGYDSDFKYALFIQALALFSAQPLLLYTAQLRQHASRQMLCYFIPITIISTPIGQALGDNISTDIVVAVGGVLVTFVACFEIYQKKELFRKWFIQLLNSFGLQIPLPSSTSNSNSDSTPKTIPTTPDDSGNKQNDKEDPTTTIIKEEEREINPDASIKLEILMKGLNADSSHNSGSSRSIEDRFGDSYGGESAMTFGSGMTFGASNATMKMSGGGLQEKSKDTTGDNGDDGHHHHHHHHDDDGDISSVEEIDYEYEMDDGGKDDKKVPQTEITEESTNSDDVLSDSNRSPQHAFDELYNIQSDTKLGTGSFSVVMEGIHRETADRYAVKVVTKAFLTDEDEEMKLENEIDILRDISHPNIVGLREVFNETDFLYIVMEKMDGGDLLTRLNGISYFPEKEAKHICRLVFGAVQYLSHRRIAHRDLKLENLLLLDDETSLRRRTRNSDSNDDNSQSIVVKLADFGFAKKETEPNSFTTMCGTPAYVAPEILAGTPYGLQVDMWSLGVITYILLAGYQPFRGDDNNDEDDIKLRYAIHEGKVKFDEEFWSNVSDHAKDLVSALLTKKPEERITADDALNHPWFSTTKLMRRSSSCTFGSIVETGPPVFFMIGSQRSGSNWLRTMLDEREDLAGPHPPHMMRDFMPIIEKFGDLTEDLQFRILVDHLCTFVERNQVPWTDRHGTKIKFSRTYIYREALNSLERVEMNREDVGNYTPLPSGMYLLCVFDAIMNLYTRLNGKRLWICKSMGMGNFHDLLLEFYGPERLRYIYLIRDPRDVAMSFMNTPVGDCHYHAIISKWTKLQQVALRVLAETPELVHKVHYEAILQKKKMVVAEIYDFIGKRRFGGVKRQASVLFMNPTDDLINRAKYGREASKAKRLSTQFRNLHRGDSFLKDQYQKWKDPETGLQEDDLELIESVAHEIMVKMGYKPHIVDEPSKAKSFSAKELEMFAELNKAAIEKMNSDLQGEDPEDYQRRVYQEEVLRLPPTILDDWDEADADIESSLRDSMQDVLDVSALSSCDKEESLVITKVVSAKLHDGRGFSFCTISQRGYYPSELQRPNQDSTKAFLEISGSEGDLIWFSVCDGHGPNGDTASQYVAGELLKLFMFDYSRGKDIKASLSAAHSAAHYNLVNNADIDTSHSGTTVTTLVINSSQNKLIVSNVGDSTCMLGSLDTKRRALSSKLLCTEHTPLIEDERERIVRSGGLIMSVDQRDGLAPMDENWDLELAPPRVWSKENPDVGGCGFTRSVGDEVAHTFGITSQPEIFEYPLRSKDRILIVASDGVTQYMNAATCVEMAYLYDDPAQAAQALIDEATNHWVDRGDCMDDMTAIVIFLEEKVSSSKPKQEETYTIGERTTDSKPDPPGLLKRVKYPGASNNNNNDDNRVDESFPIDTIETIKEADNIMEKKNDTADGEGGIQSIKETDDVMEKKNDTTDGEGGIPLGFNAIFWTLFAGFASGFLGGLCGIRGPPIIFYFMHPPHPVAFNKNSQRATGAAITACNVGMRIVYYMVDTLAFGQDSYFDRHDILLYVSVIIFSILGVLVGSHLFTLMKDSTATIRGILAIFLLLCGISLLLSAFADV